MDLSKNNQYLRSIELKKDKIESYLKYPFCLFSIKSLITLEFHPKITFIVGENGSCKSTILEAIATAYGFNPEGGTKNFNFSSRDTHSELQQYIKLVKGLYILDEPEAALSPSRQMSMITGMRDLIY